MKIAMKNFGAILVSRPAGREAALAALSYLAWPPPTDTIELDFEGVKVLAPSWADEFVNGLKEKLKNPIKILDADNPSVIESFKIIHSA